MCAHRWQSSYWIPHMFSQSPWIWVSADYVPLGGKRGNLQNQSREQLKAAHHSVLTCKHKCSACNSSSCHNWYKADCIDWRREQGHSINHSAQRLSQKKQFWQQKVEPSQQVTLLNFAFRWKGLFDPNISKIKLTTQPVTFVGILISNIKQTV